MAEKPPPFGMSSERGLSPERAPTATKFAEVPITKVTARWRSRLALNSEVETTSRVARSNGDTAATRSRDGTPSGDLHGRNTISPR